MFFRTLLMVALVVMVTGCETNKSSDVGDIYVQDEMTAGPLGEIYEGQNVLSDGPLPGSQADLVVNVGDRVFFGYDRHDLTPEAQSTLQLQADWMKRYPQVNISIEGHCDERGTREYNLALGERRANSVKSFLVALGVDARRINTISYGKERPAVLNSNAAAWAQNRRGVTVVE